MAFDSTLYDSYIKQAIAYIGQQRDANPQPAANWGVSESGPDVQQNPEPDYYNQWLDTLTPAQRNEFAIEDAKALEDKGVRWQTKVGKVLKIAIPAMVGGAAIGPMLGGAAAGASGGAAGTAVGGSGSLLGGGIGGTGSGLGVAGLNAGSGVALGGAGATATGLAGWGGALGSAVPVGSAIGSLGSSSLGSSLGGVAGGDGVAAGGSAAGGAKGLGSWLESIGVPSGLSSAIGSIPTNALLSGLAGLASGVGSSMSGDGEQNQWSKTPGVPINYGTLQRSPGQAAPQSNQPMMAAKYKNSGLGRFGPGLFNPDPFATSNYYWGK